MDFFLSRVDSSAGKAISNIVISGGGANDDDLIDEIKALPLNSKVFLSQSEAFVLPQGYWEVMFTDAHGILLVDEDDLKSLSVAKP